MSNIKRLKQEDNLSVWLERGKTDIFTVTVMMTADLARRLLARNDENRPLRVRGRTRCVEAYAEAMKRGEWDLNGQAIIVSEDGLLNDGQHRLHAVILSGMSVEMQITFGVRRSTRHTVDQGAARTPGNILAMYGHKNANPLAHALHFMWVYEDGRSFNDRPSPDQILNVLEEHPGLQAALSAGRSIASEFKTSVGYVGAAYYVCAGIDENAADNFVHQVSTGLGVTDKRSPVLKLRKRFNDHFAKREIIPAVEQAALFIKSFNAYRRGQSMSNLSWRRYGAAAEAFPRAR